MAVRSRTYTRTSANAPAPYSYTLLTLSVSQLLVPFGAPRQFLNLLPGSGLFVRFWAPFPFRGSLSVSGFIVRLLVRFGFPCLAPCPFRCRLSVSGLRVCFEIVCPFWRHVRFKPSWPFRRLVRFGVPCSFRSLVSVSESLVRGAPGFGASFSVSAPLVPFEACCSFWGWLPVSALLSVPIPLVRFDSLARFLVSVRFGVPCPFGCLVSVLGVRFRI